MGYNGGPGRSSIGRRWCYLALFTELASKGSRPFLADAPWDQRMGLFMFLLAAFPVHQALNFVFHYFCVRSACFRFGCA